MSSTSTSTIYASPVSSFQEFEGRLGDILEGKEPSLRVLKPKKDTMVLDKETKEPLFILRKNRIPREMYEPIATEYAPIVRKMESSNRGFAAGMKQRIQRNHFEKSQSIQSAIAGYMDSPNHKYPCRLTKFSRDYFEKYQNGIPFFREIDKCFKETLPERHARQSEKAEKTEFRIDSTAFTTITMNYNFQTAIHLDKGDCKEGFGTLVVCSKGVRGGELVFPRYQIGVAVENGDVLLMNVHEYHCNLPIQPIEEGGYRLSFVCYLREKLLDCKYNEVLRELGFQENKHWDTEVFVRKILNEIGLNYEDRVMEGTVGEWSIENSLYLMACRKRQYYVYDKTEKRRIISLVSIWKYLKERSEQA